MIFCLNCEARSGICPVHTGKYTALAKLSQFKLNIIKLEGLDGLQKQAADRNLLPVSV